MNKFHEEVVNRVPGTVHLTGESLPDRRHQHGRVTGEEYKYNSLSVFDPVCKDVVASLFAALCCWQDTVP
jgi:hypothetical protein